MLKPCNIPHTLKVGDILHLRNGDVRIVEKVGKGRKNKVDFYDMVGDQYPMTYYPNPKGSHSSCVKDFDIMSIRRRRKVLSKTKASKFDALMKEAKLTLKTSYGDDDGHQVQYDEGYLAGLKDAKKALKADAKRLDNE